MFYPILMAVALINDNASCLPACLPVASLRNVTEISALWVASNQRQFGIPYYRLSGCR